jgi:hypothetical protein
MHRYVLSGRVFHRPAKAVVLEAVFRHDRRIEQVAPIDYQRPVHETMDSLPVESAKLIPFR